MLSTELQPIAQVLPDLREQAVAADAASAVDLDLAVLWRELVRGACKIVDCLFTEQRCLLVTAPKTLPGTSIEGRRLAILQAILCGCGQKNIAIDLGLAASTVALNARLALATVGVFTKPSRVHPLLMLAARAASDPGSPIRGRASFIEQDGAPLRVVSVARPDASLGTLLPPAELAVVKQLIEGQCYAEIARLRGTSQRTIANQITAVFRRMRVSGRNELVHRLWPGSMASRSTFVRSRSPAVGAAVPNCA